MPVAYNSAYAYDSIITYNGAFSVPLTFGSTFVSELNRLANGGATYPAHSAYLGPEGAANRWAGTTARTLVGALNVKNGTRTLALEGVCNALAGTTNKSATDALRMVVS